MDEPWKNGSQLWAHGTKLYVGWPNLRQRQLRVCLAVNVHSKRRVGFFARVDEPVASKVSSNRALMAIWLAGPVLQVVFFYVFDMSVIRPMLAAM